MADWSSSPFFEVPPPAWLVANRSAFAIADTYPVSPGHALVVSRRLIATWWEATPEEQADILVLVDEVRQLLDAQHRPDGYNIGINVGDAAGQTVPHLHVHVIPRYAGDIADPRGGVRHVIPHKGNYLLPVDDREPHLTEGGSEGLGTPLLRLMRDPAFDRIDLVVSFVMRSGWTIVEAPLTDAVEGGAVVRVLTTDYLNYTDPHALTRLLDLTTTWPDRVAVKIFSDPGVAFHPKSYLFWSSRSERAMSFVGSSNLSRSGLDGGVEWNLGVPTAGPMREAFERLWADDRTFELDEGWLQAYRHRRPLERPASPGTVAPEVVDEPEAPVQPVAPRPIQQEALLALEATRAAGHRAGLVVMATGLGKTWLAAFDTARPAFRRVLFIAHRDEILRQSLEVFRRVQPDQSLGIYMGERRERHANVVFASVQTLVRHLEDFDPREFDYVVVDEFHHAAARSYRHVIDHFSPAFLLGLTATPERMDGADLLGLCDDNLVYECNVVEGIDRDELVPFAYHGIRDIIDFAPIPWRNGRFDPAQLTAAIETRERAAHAMAEWERRRGTRTLAFCVTTTHADFMAAYAAEQGLQATAVHSGPTSAGRRESVERLERGELDILFTVDVFNEGFDLPSIDTVLMLRPTDSPVVFLQQLGRGLRLQEGKEQLTVVDFIGNHRSFLLKPRTLLGLGMAGAPSNRDIQEAIERGAWPLPPGCSVNWTLDAIDLLAELARDARRRPGSALVEYLQTHHEEFGERATAMQALRAGLNPASARSTDGGWFGLVDGLGPLTAEEGRVWRRHRAFFDELMTTSMTRSYKFVLLRALIHDGALLTGAPLDRLAQTSHDLVVRDPRLVADATTTSMPDPVAAPASQWARMWRANPVTAWTGGLSAGAAWWRVEDERFVPTFDVAEEDGPTFVALVSELVEWRLGEYLLRRQPAREGSGVIECAVSHANGNPIVRFDRSRHPSLPQGTTPFLAGGEEYEGDFVKIVLNVARRPGEKGNALHSLLRGWFGPSAGLPGTRHRVVLEEADGQWVMRPIGVDAQVAPNVLPLYPDYQVACGQFAAAIDGSAAAAHIELRDQLGEAHDPEREFVAVASGESMAEGPDAVNDGELVLLRWVRDRSRADLVGHRVLVEYDGGGGPTAALKDLDRDGSGYVLRSANPVVAPIRATGDMRVVAEYVRKVAEREVNPLAEHIGTSFRRQDIPPLYGQTFNPGNWNSGHVSLGDDVVLFITLHKTAGSEGADYDDRFEDHGVLVWSSQTSTGPDTKKGREILDAPAEGRRIHAWIRRRKADVAFEYRGLAVPLSHEGERPMSVRFRLLTPLDAEAQRRLR